MAKICPLYSGSSGNSTFIGDSSSGILIDIGVSCKKLISGLETIGQKPENIKAVFITHEHSDHIQGVSVFLKRYKIPLFASAGTIAYMEEHGCFCEGAKYYELQSGGTEVAGMEITSAPTPHDAKESVCYRIEYSGKKIAVATDIGYITKEIEAAVKGCDAVLIESNYDIKMLDSGSYPYYLKKRIKGRKGHLSNPDCAEMVLRLVLGGSTRIFLGHLSEENNSPDIAYQATFQALREQGLFPDKDYLLRVADRYKPSAAYSF
ncbi:MAG: MBL fold metallo-hydrolase [Oscillospiraceae bacterium]|jgi:phosphoribosyl 1,2-cyclic phosphodiesterase|nr:MBL fold metallo-hydrolase [Oscillospiraceae bacterium]